MSEPVINVLNLTKSYGKFLAVDNIDFEVQPGEIFGLLGPNGAGKTTQGNRQEVLEHFKGYFCGVCGASHFWSSSASWA